jgi:hypothetical protein
MKCIFLTLKILFNVVWIFFGAGIAGDALEKFPVFHSSQSFPIGIIISLRDRWMYVQLDRRVHGSSRSKWMLGLEPFLSVLIHEQEVCGMNHTRQCRHTLVKSVACSAVAVTYFQRKSHSCGQIKRFHLTSCMIWSSLFKRRRVSRLNPSLNYQLNTEIKLLNYILWGT